MSAYPETTRSILLTNVNGSDENALVFTSLTAPVLAGALRRSGKVTFEEYYEVPDDDRQYYLHEPCHLTVAEENQARRLAQDLPLNPP